MHPSLLPFQVVPYDPEWADRFATERSALLSRLGPLVADIRHFGSTSIPNLWAKPTIDILLGTHVWPWQDDAVLETLGYTFYKSPGKRWRVYLKAQGHDPRGVHLHVVEDKSDHWKRHLLFRDYLSAHPDQAERYGAFKRGAAIRFGDDRGAYQQAKAALVQTLADEAKVWNDQNGDNSDMD